MKFASVLLVALLAACGGGGAEQVSAVQPAAIVAPEPVVQPLQAYLFLGQSNMSGWISRVAELPPEMQAPQQAVAWTGTAWEALRPSDTVALFNQDGAFGPEISFAFRKGAIGVVKFAKGGSGLAGDWLPPGGLLDQAIAKARAAQASRPIKFVGALWDQGGSDMDTMEHAQAYAANLRALVAKLRAELNAPDMRFVSVREYTREDSIPNTFPGRAVVRAALENPGIANYGWINADDLVPLGDRAHYTTPNIVKIGERLAAEMP